MGYEVYSALPVWLFRGCQLHVEDTGQPQHSGEVAEAGKQEMITSWWLYMLLHYAPLGTVERSSVRDVRSDS